MYEEVVELNVAVTKSVFNKLVQCRVEKTPNDRLEIETRKTFHTTGGSVFTKSLAI